MKAIVHATPAARGLDPLATPRVVRQTPEWSRQLEWPHLESELYLALQRDEFCLHYQPRAQCADLAITGFEALVRWQHPRRGIIGPGEFIEMAEQSGLIVPLGEWVLQSACAQAVAWQRAGLPRLRIGVNVSPWQIRQGSLVARVGNVLAQTGLDAACLELEITESSIFHDSRQAMETLRDLHVLGVHLALDDFGTGYSNFAELKRSPLRVVKVDRSFLEHLPWARDNAAIVQAILVVGRKLGLRVIAEGVETDAQLAFLRAHGCDEIQGFMLSRPLPAEAVPNFLKSAIASPGCAHPCSV